MAAVIRLGLMSRAAEAKKSRWIGVGAKLQIFKLPNASPSEPHPDEARKIEQGVALAGRRSEEALTIRILGGKTRDEIGADFVIAPPDHRTERRVNPTAVSAKSLHCGDGRLDNAGQRAPPAGMGRADHTGCRIGEKDRAAIGRGYADRKPRGAGDDTVGTRTLLWRPRGLDGDRVWRVDLIGGEETLRFYAKRRRDARSVFSDIGSVVARTDPAIKAGVETTGNTALPRKEAVADTFESENSRPRRSSFRPQSRAAPQAWDR